MRLVHLAPAPAPRYAAGIALSMLNARQIARLQQEATERWHREAWNEPALNIAFEGLVLQQHRANFDLWHREDDARDPQAQDADIALVKRAIDALNQRRNDLVEAMDQMLLAATPQNVSCELHSETPGLIVDRLSILSLKIFHTAEQASREDVLEAHRLRNRERLGLLHEQRDDLTTCLEELWTAVTMGRRRFKLYRQLKMYNDPTLNPVLYRRRGGAEHDSGAGSPAERSSH